MLSSLIKTYENKTNFGREWNICFVLSFHQPKTVGNHYFKQPTFELSIVHCISVSILRHQFDLTNWYCFDACFTSCSVQCTHWSTWPNCPHSLKRTTISASDFTLHSWNVILNQTKQQFMSSFIPIVYPCCALSAAGCFLLPPPCLSLHPFSPHMKRWVALSPHTAICFVESPRDTLAYLSSATQTSKSVLASQRDGEAPPGSRRRLQSTRCSPGIKYPFR